MINVMLYDEAWMALIKERLEDLYKEKNCPLNSFLSKPEERSVNISYTNLKNYEVNNPVAPSSMSSEFLVVFVDFYDVLDEYLQVLSNSCKHEYYNISDQLELCD